MSSEVFKASKLIDVKRPLIVDYSIIGERIRNYFLLSLKCLKSTSLHRTSHESTIRESMILLSYVFLTKLFDLVRNIGHQHQVVQDKCTLWCFLKLEGISPPPL